MRLLSLLLTSLLGLSGFPSAQAQEAATVPGKDGWYFFRYERTDPTLRPEINKTLKLLEKANRLFKENQITLVLSITPLKMRLYGEHLPKDFQTIPGMENNHAEVVSKLRQGGVLVTDQEIAFKKSIRTDPEKLLYLRQDSHWTPAGAMIAAKSLQELIQQDTATAKLIDALPVSQFEQISSNHPVGVMSRDLMRTLPKGSTPPPPDLVPSFDVKRLSESASLQSGRELPQITLLGSSFVSRNTQFPNALRLALQRDLLDISTPGWQGPWVGMESYLRNPAFIANRPQLIIWEIPERDLANPPQSPWRDKTYRREEEEWLANLASQLATRCVPASTTVNISAQQLSKQNPTPSNSKGQQGDSDRPIELSFDTPLKADEFLMLEMAATGETDLRFEACDAKKKTVYAQRQLPDDGKTYPINISLPRSSGEISKICLYTDDTPAFSIQRGQVCRLDKPWLFQ
jgi:alginate O-acetyltransferase complex protein AlgJ